jgi:hypothetical protein
MRTSLTRRRGFTVCLVGLAATVAGCGGSGSSPQGSAAAVVASPLTSSAASTAPSTEGSASTTPTTTPKKVQANGGGDFCKLIASASNTDIGGDSAASAEATITKARGQERQALALAPDSIKADVTLLFNASNVMYDALAKVNYDYTKLTSADMAPLGSADVTAAEKRLQTYVTTVCKIS